MRASELVDLFPESVARSELEIGKRQFVFRQGDATRGIFVVVSGQVRLERSTAAGRVAVLQVASPGECFAEASLFASHYHCDAVALEPSRIVLLAKDAVLGCLQSNRDVSLRYVGLLSSEVRALRSRVELSTILSAEERLREYLERSVDPVTRELVLTGSLKDLAAELGLAHETLYRELRRMERNGKLVRRGDHLTLSGA